MNTSYIYLILTIFFIFACGGLWDYLYNIFNAAYMRKVENKALSNDFITDTLKEDYDIDIEINEIDGLLREHYYGRDESLDVCECTLKSSSVGALCVSAYEIAKVVNYHRYIISSRFINIINVIINIIAKLAWPLLLIGFIILNQFEYHCVVQVGFILLGLTLFLQLVKIPLEKQIIEEANYIVNGFIEEDESQDKKIINKLLLLLPFKSYCNAYGYISTLLRVVFLGKHKHIKNDVSSQYKVERMNEKEEFGRTENDIDANVETKKTGVKTHERRY